MARVEEDAEEDEGDKNLVRQEEARALGVVFIDLDVAQVDSDEVPKKLAWVSQDHRHNTGSGRKQHLILYDFTLLIFELDVAEDPWI